MHRDEAREGNKQDGKEGEFEAAKQPKLTIHDTEKEEVRELPLCLLQQLLLIGKQVSVKCLQAAP